MNRQKFNNLSVSAGIHTVGIMTNDWPKNLERYSGIIERERLKTNSEDGTFTFSAKVNPNTYFGQPIKSHEQFKSILDELLEKIGIQSYLFTRIDFNFDYYEDNFVLLHKLHKCLILLISLNYGMNNCFEVKDSFALDDKSFNGKSRYYEVENYNKIKESNGKSPAKNRFELRSIRLTSKKQREIPCIANEWIKKLEKISKIFPDLQQHCNQYLLQKWLQEQTGQVKNIYEFVRKYQDNIFTSKQLSDFYSALELPNSVQNAYKFVYRNQIECFSNKDIEIYINTLIKSMKDFLQI